MTTRRDILMGTLIVPFTGIIAAESTDDSQDVYDEDGHPLYVPCKVCPSLTDNPIAYGAFGVVVIGAQSIEPFSIRVTSSYVESSWDNECPACKGLYPKNNRINTFDTTGRVGAINTVSGGLKLAVPSNESATVKIWDLTHGKGLVREFTPTFNDKLNMEVFI